LLTESPAPSGRQARLTGVVAVLSLILASLVAAPAEAAEPVTYTDHVYSSTATAATADKPQSKVWYTDGAWWALMVTPAGTVNIYKLGTNHAWTDTGTVVDTRGASTGDALFSGGKLYIASRTGGTSGAVKVYKFSYSTSTKKYTPDPAFTTKTFSGGGTESATIDRDSMGALWVTFTRGSAVYVSNTTNAAQTTWSSPFRITGADTSVSTDDISAVIAFDGNKIGVLWSDQASNAMRFAYHVDGTASTAWKLEDVLTGTGIADDHINIKSMTGDSAGRIYAAVKTSKTGATDPIIYVVTRGVNGTWTSRQTATVADKLTRPQLALDSINQTVYIMQSTELGGTVYYKSAPMSNTPQFATTGKGATFIAAAGAKINNVSTTKDPVTPSTGLVAIASDEFTHTYYHAEMALNGAATPGDTTAPPAPVATPPGGTYASTQSVTLASEAGATIRYTIGTAPADPTPTSGSVYGGPITVSSSQSIKAIAIDAAGNVSPVARANYTISAGSSTSTIILNPVADTMAKQGTPATNYAGTSPLQADSRDVSTSSTSAIHSYLRFTIPSLTAGQSITGASLSLKAVNGTPDGPAIYRTATGWTDTSVNWNAKPARSGDVAIGNFGSVALARVQTAVTGVTGAGDISFELAPESTDGMDFVSGDSTSADADKPQLILTITGS